MSKKIIRVLALCLVVCLFCSGCSFGSKKVVIEPMEPEEVVTFGFDFIGGTDVMPFSGFYGPFPANGSIEGNQKTNTVTEQVFADLAEAGVNHLSGFGWDMEANKKYTDLTFKYGEKYKIGITLNSNRQYILNPKDADAYLKKYKDKYKSFVSYFVGDEPSGLEYFANPDNEIILYKPYFDVLNELGYFPYLNLLPLYDLKQKKEYSDYVDRYLDLCKPPVLSYDHYLASDTPIPPYFYNMGVIREKAEERKIPWWGFIGCGQDFFGCSQFEYPNEYQFDWNINTTLAYGAKGIQYYVAVQNAEEIQIALGHFDTLDEEAISKSATRIGIIGGYGHRTRYWHYSKELTEHIRVFDEILMNSVNKGIITSTKSVRSMFSEYTKYLIDGNSWRELKDVVGEAMIGCFNYNGKSVYYVVNFDREYAQKITLKFHDKYKFYMVKNAEKSYIETNKLTLDMVAGEGVLLMVE